MMTDPIADMLTRVRNSVRFLKSTVDVPFSIEKKGIADTLKREGYIWDYEVIEGKPLSHLRFHLKYGPNGEQIINKLQRVSKPGRRLYAKVGKLKPVLNGLGISVLNTNKGIMSDREAVASNLGGEVICTVW